MSHRHTLIEEQTWAEMRLIGDMLSKQGHAMSCTKVTVCYRERHPDFMANPEIHNLAGWGWLRSAYNHEFRSAARGSSNNQLELFEYDGEQLQWPRQIQVVEDNETAPKNSIDASDEEIMQAAEVLRKEGLFKCKLADNASSYLAWRRQQRQRLNAAPGTSI